MCRYVFIYICSYVRQHTPVSYSIYVNVQMISNNIYLYSLSSLNLCLDLIENLEGEQTRVFLLFTTSLGQN